jgi:hypothetical protein
MPISGRERTGGFGRSKYRSGRLHLRQTGPAVSFAKRLPPYEFVACYGTSSRMVCSAAKQSGANGLLVVGAVRQLSRHRALRRAEHELLLIGVEELVDQPLLETWRLPPEDTFHRLDQLGDAEFLIGAV